jgi:hypothetical protein
VPPFRRSTREQKASDRQIIAIGANQRADCLSFFASLQINRSSPTAASGHIRLHFTLESRWSVVHLAASATWISGIRKLHSLLVPARFCTKHQATPGIALTGGGAAGPWAAAVIHDMTGSYRLAFMVAIACCVISAITIWRAAPRKVRVVPDRIR